MRSRTIAILLALTAFAPCARPVSASGVPLASLSFVTQPMVACPAGDVVLTTIMRNAANNPIPLADVVVSFEGCPSIQLPPVLGDEGYTVVPGTGTVGPVLRGTGDQNGEKDFAIRAGGGCPASAVRVYGNGNLVALRSLASPDQDGNLSVGPEDVAIATAKLGSSDPTADFDGDGAVTQADVAILRTHLGHHAPGMATPVASRTWGTLKLLYR
jgi:hypothetical protein